MNLGGNRKEERNREREEGGRGKGERRKRERERFVMFHYKYHRSQEASCASFIFHNMLLGEPAFPVINHLLFLQRIDYGHY